MDLPSHSSANPIAASESAASSSRRPAAVASSDATRFAPRIGLAGGAPRFRLRLGGELPLELGVARERKASARSSPALPTGAASAFAAAAAAASDAAASAAAAAAAPGGGVGRRNEQRAERLDLGEDAALPRRAARRSFARIVTVTARSASRARSAASAVVVGADRRTAAGAAAGAIARLPGAQAVALGARRRAWRSTNASTERSRRRAASSRASAASGGAARRSRRNLSLDAAERLRHHAPVALEVARLGPRRAQLLAHARTLLARGRKVSARGGELPLLLRLSVLDRQVLSPRLSSAASLNCV